jgi:iron complex transport system substrate-binding protein
VRCFLCVLGLVACGSLFGGGQITLEQADGSELLLPAPATRVITLSPHLTELVFAAGAGDRLIATVEYSDYPESARDVPRIGDAFRLDIERIVALRPDLVIAWDSGTPRPAVAQMRALGIPVWSVEIREPGEIADILEATGKATAEPGTAGAMALRQRLVDLSERYQGLDVLEYFYQVGSTPLFTVNGDQLISKGLSLCGGRNIFADEPALAFQMSHESVIVADPDALFAPYQDGKPDPLMAWRDWPSMQAVRQDALFLLPADPVSRATPRFLDSLELACKLLNGLREHDTND